MSIAMTIIAADGFANARAWIIILELPSHCSVTLSGLVIAAKCVTVSVKSDGELESSHTVLLAAELGKMPGSMYFVPGLPKSSLLILEFRMTHFSAWESTALKQQLSTRTRR